MLNLECVLAMGVTKNCIVVAAQLVQSRPNLSSKSGAAPAAEGSNTSKS